MVAGGFSHLLVVTQAARAAWLSERLRKFSLESYVKGLRRCYQNLGAVHPRIAFLSERYRSQFNHVETGIIERARCESKQWASETLA